MNNVVRLKIEGPYDQFPLVARYKLDAANKRYQMYIAYDAFVVVEFHDDGARSEYTYPDSEQAGLLHWIAFIKATLFGTASDIHLTPTGTKRLLIASIAYSAVLAKQFDA